MGEPDESPEARAQRGRRVWRLDPVGLKRKGGEIRRPIKIQDEAAGNFAILQPRQIYAARNSTSLRMRRAAARAAARWAILNPLAHSGSAREANGSTPCASNKESKTRPDILEPEFDSSNVPE